MLNILLGLVFIGTAFLNGSEDGYAKYIEYDLPNGLHVILSRDINEPNAIVGMKYHVGAKNEKINRTGIAHFTEHLFFHGTENIPQGQFENMIMNAGGYCNAYTHYDVTYYYQVLPAHEYKLGLWAEAERMKHAVITEEGLAREREIVKEERRMRYDNKALGNSYYDMMELMFDHQTYGHNMVGTMEDLDAITLKDVENFIKSYYVPNNACLIVAGNIDIANTRKWIDYYFRDIPEAPRVKRPDYFGEPAGKELVFRKSIDGIEAPAIAMCFYTMAETDKDADVLKVIAAILSGSTEYSFFDRDIVAKGDTIIRAPRASTELWEKVGALRITGRLAGSDNEEYFIGKIDEQLDRLKNEYLDDHFLDGVLNAFESGFTDQYFHAESLAQEISSYYLLWSNTAEFNEVLKRYREIKPDDIRRVANKYFNPDNRIIIIYNPAK